MAFMFLNLDPEAHKDGLWSVKTQAISFYLYGITMRQNSQLLLGFHGDWWSR